LDRTINLNSRIYRFFRECFAGCRSVFRCSNQQRSFIRKLEQLLVRTGSKGALSDKFATLLVADCSSDDLGGACGAAVDNYSKRTMEYHFSGISCKGLGLFFALSKNPGKCAIASKEIGHRHAFLNLPVCGPSQIEDNFLGAF